jgi:hypothetical protein
VKDLSHLIHGAKIENRLEFCVPILSTIFDNKWKNEDRIFHVLSFDIEISRILSILYTNTWETFQVFQIANNLQGSVEDLILASL